MNSKQTQFNDLPSVLILNADSKGVSALKRIVRDLGYPILKVLDSDHALLAEVVNLQPDLLVVGIDSPKQQILEKISIMQQTCPCPVVMFAEHDAPEITERIVTSGVNGYVVADIQAHVVPRIFTIAITRFKESQKLHKELEATKNKLETRKIIDHAKGLMMSHQDINEKEAHKRLQKFAMDKSISLEEAAQKIVEILSLLK